MKKTAKKSTRTSKKISEFRPYRVLFLVVVVAVTCIVMFAMLGVSTDM